MRFDGFRRNPLHKTYLMINDKCCPTAEATDGSQWILHRYRYQIHFLDLIKSEGQDHSKHPSRVVYKSQKPESLFQALSWSWPAKLWWAQEKIMQRLGSPLVLFLSGFFHSPSSFMPTWPTENFSGYSRTFQHLPSQGDKVALPRSLQNTFSGILISIFFLWEPAGPKSSHWIGPLDTLSALT